MWSCLAARMKNDCGYGFFHPDLAKFGLGDRCVPVDSLTGAANRESTIAFSRKHRCHDIVLLWYHRPA
jgi:hypothetical protein